MFPYESILLSFEENKYAVAYQSFCDFRKSDYNTNKEEVAIGPTAYLNNSP